ncbi:MAG: type IV secretory system conjugative DNA transfer family protein [Bacteroidales bacterium]|nr:type IV secretory system conjugative DNA transfer family protein [Bacteroidales bacterium]
MEHIINYFQQLTLVSKLILTVVVLVVSLLQFLVLSYKIKLYLRILLILLIQILVYLFFNVFFTYSLPLHLAIFILACLLSIIFLILTETNFLNDAGKTDPIWSVKFPIRNSSPLIMQNIKRGIAIFGSAGSGKTESGFVPILKHAGERNIPCLCYDYKNGEITEIAHFFFQNSTIKQATIIPHSPMYSDRVNPFLPKYIPTEQHLRQQTKLIFANLKKVDNVKESGSSFFDKIPEPTLAAVIWRLKVDYPEMCTLPHAVALCLVKTPTEIVDFISENPYSRAIGSPLIDSLISENQVAGVKASLSLPLTDLALPTIFWVMSANDVDLDINNPENPTFLSIVNDPRLERINAPFISVIISTAINSMQIRNRPASFLLFDEGTTFYIDGISKIPATMRSYNIATVFSTQDRALARENYGDVITSSLLANLSYQMIGKANDPDSVRYYKNISEEIEKRTISRSFTNSVIGGDTRTSEGTRETSKYKNQDFTGLTQGQFFVFADGKDKLYNFDLYPFKRLELKVKHHITEKDLNDNFNRIMNEVKNL